MARFGPSSRLLRAAVAVVICCTASDCQDVHPRQRPGGLRRRNVWSCASDVLLLCKDVAPGQGRIEECLESKHYYLNSMCAGRRLAADKMPPACQQDVEVLCEGSRDDSFHLMCLRKHRNKISQRCWDDLSKLASHGWEPLPNRFQHMGVDSECMGALLKACTHIAPGYGALHQCVQDNWDQLSAQCGLRARVVPEHVPPACHHDALMLCKHLTPGNNRIHECLWKFDGVRNEDGHKLSDHCLSSLILSSHGMDLECAEDMTKLCGHDHRDQRRLISCLHAHQEKLAAGCTTRKHLHLIDELVAARGPTHHNLHTGTHAEGCGPDIRKYCAGIRAGHGLIHQCLLDNRHRLSAECRVPRGQVVRRGSAADAEAEAARARAREAAASNASLGSSGESWEDVGHLVFEKNDRDNDGVVTAAELSAALVHRYDRSADGEAARQVAALRILSKYDIDGSRSLDEEEFIAMTAPLVQRVTGLKEEAGTGDAYSTGAARSAAGEEGQDLQGGRRSFVKRQPRRVSAWLTSWWVMMPVGTAIVGMVLSYRSNVRRSTKRSSWASAGYTVTSSRKSR
eukprot:Tamp_05937.p1 GENE.Tamp_05937~~Tamp_05937.p1  ORF type:complete len:569 (+),score=82.91 Tamp_05937:3-1709(+)